MDDDSLATVIPFPLHRVGGRASLPAPAPPEAARGLEPRAVGAEQYWARVQSLAAERRALAGGAG
jgi:hypothetical protein